MANIEEIILAFFMGLFFGMILSIPVGPVNLTIMNRAAQRGFLYGCLLGLGASLMETIYCTIAFGGFASFFEKGIIKSAMEVASFLFLMILGIRFLTATTIPNAGSMEEKVEATFKPHSAFMTGFISVLGNPGVLLFWIALAAHLISHEWVQPSLSSKGACILGVATGTSLWFTSLSYMVSRGHGKFKDSTLLLMERGSGMALLGLGLYYGGKIALELARSRHHF